MTSHYVNITKEEFDTFAASQGFTTIQYKRSREVVYTREKNSARILIFSSISQSAGTGRSVGEDAIRVVVQGAMYEDGHFDKWKSFWKSRRVHRTKNWRDNLNERLDHAFDQIDPEPCPICGSAIVRREGKHGAFYSCIMWPRTQCPGKAP